MFVRIMLVLTHALVEMDTDLIQMDAHAMVSNSRAMISSL